MKRGTRQFGGGREWVTTACPQMFRTVRHVVDGVCNDRGSKRGDLGGGCHERRKCVSHTTDVELRGEKKDV